MTDDVSTTSSDTAEIARESIMSKMVSPQRGIVREEIKREGALIISNAQREALSLDHKMEEIRRLAAEVTNIANNTPAS